MGEVTRISAYLVNPTDSCYRDLPHINGENIEAETGRLGQYRTAAEDKVVSQKFKFEKGDVLYSKLRPYLRKAAIAPSDGLCSAEMYPLKVDEQLLLPDFLLMELLSERFSRYAIDESARSRMPKLNREALFRWEIKLPPLAEQRRIIAALKARAAERSAAAEEVSKSLVDLQILVDVELNDALKSASKSVLLGECLTEVKSGVGKSWSDYSLLGATRQGIAPAKEPVGQNPERYKFASAGTIFYNPMRILIGSIALVDDESTEGIVSPDYVVAKPKLDRLLPRFFYSWLRSKHGARAILGTAKGAVRERMMFKGLTRIEMPLPNIEKQQRFDRIYVAADRTRSRLTAQQQELDALEPALLRAAFSGTL